jgi:UDPglucose 6-dehydrogenase
MRKVVIVGTGYVGLVTGTCFAELKNDVTCVDIDAAKIQAMKDGAVPIYEPGLEDVFKQNIAVGRLHFTTDLASAMEGAEVVFLALPTPPGDDGSADLSYVLGVADSLGPLLKQYAVIVDKSTVPVGTAEKVHERIAAKATVPFDVVSNPEFLREGFAVQDFMHPNRVVIGTSSEEARMVMQDMYAPITDDDHPLLFMNERSAELTKYAANSFLAMKITFMNQIANLCERVDADVDAVRMGVGTDERIGSRFLYPGIGYGGSCFPKDVLALMHTANEFGYDFDLLRSVIDHNKEQQKVLINKILQHYDNNVSGKTFALWGLAFKPDTDDIREAPALAMIEALTAAGATIQAYDPEAMPNVRKRFEGNDKLTFAEDKLAALRGADALLIATEWRTFAQTPIQDIKKLLASPTVFDGRNIFSIDAMSQLGFYYESVGRPIVTS